jgi:uncharacterized circularly permuted ATP-grasp superfamily protein
MRTAAAYPRAYATYPCLFQTGMERTQYRGLLLLVVARQTGRIQSVALSANRIFIKPVVTFRTIRKRSCEMRCMPMDMLNSIIGSTWSRD